MGAEGQESLLGEWGELWGAGTRWVVLVCLTANPDPLYSSPQAPELHLRKGLACPAPKGEGRQRGGHPGFALITRVTRLSFSGLQFVRWRLQYYLPGVAFVRTGLDTNTGKAHG